ncbi:MAG: hypothetical protein Q7R35_02570 [Elusimicrobiota bacterium]|nr:hypothetical protein [Elusimicrobiota bacterium]
MKTKNIKIESKMKVTMLLADHAQAVNGKLYIMGGGWSVTGPKPCQSALAIKIEVPWNEANRKHNLKLELVNADYRPVLIPTPVGESPLVLSASFEVGRPPGVIVGSTLGVPLAFNIAPIPLEPGQRYIWRLTINEITEDNWMVVFSTREVQPTPKQLDSQEKH